MSEGMTAGEHQMPPHLERYLESLNDPGRDVTPHAAQGRTAETAPLTVPHDPPRDLYIALSRHSGAIQADGHVNPADAARWKQAQTELADLIRAENRGVTRDPEAAALLPDELGPWMEKRVAELRQAESGEPALEIEPPG